MTDKPSLKTRRDALAASIAAVSALTLAASAARAQGAANYDPTPVGETPPTGDIHDFDYQLGSWTAINRRMKHRWTANPEWETFSGHDRYEILMDGMVNLDVVVFPQKGFSGTTVRVFNLARRQWFIYWISSKDGVLTPPMIGGYNGNRGVFYGDDTDDGVLIKARYIRTKQPPNGERWEQAFSRDGGKTWETNWTADFTRVT
jgi:hypothetical protein